MTEATADLQAWQLRHSTHTSYTAGLHEAHDFARVQVLDASGVAGRKFAGVGYEQELLGCEGSAAYLILQSAGSSPLAEAGSRIHAGPA